MSDIWRDFSARELPNFSAGLACDKEWLMLDSMLKFGES